MVTLRLGNADTAIVGALVIAGQVGVESIALALVIGVFAGVDLSLDVGLASFQNARTMSASCHTQKDDPTYFWAAHAPAVAADVVVVVVTAAAKEAVATKRRALNCILRR